MDTQIMVPLGFPFKQKRKKNKQQTKTTALKGGLPPPQPESRAKAHPGRQPRGRDHPLADPVDRHAPGLWED